MNCFFSSSQDRRPARPETSRSFLTVLPLWLAVLTLAASSARAQSVNASGPDGYHWSSQGGILLQPVLWQHDGPSGPPPGPSDRRRPRRRPGPPPLLLERLKNLTPEQREKVLENNRRFRRLPPERQEQLRMRLRQLQELSPEQREMVEQRFAIFSNLTPKQQEKARKLYEDRWRKLPPERRRALLQEFRRLRRLDPDKRKQRLESKELKDQFSSEEREVLTQLMAL
jgi:DNA-directed RNA polymerase subunit F